MQVAHTFPHSHNSHISYVDPGTLRCSLGLLIETLELCFSSPNYSPPYWWENSGPDRSTIVRLGPADPQYTTLCAHTKHGWDMPGV